MSRKQFEIIGLVEVGGQTLILNDGPHNSYRRCKDMSMEQRLTLRDRYLNKPQARFMEPALNNAVCPD